MSIGGDARPWYPDQSPSLGGRPEQDIAGTQQQYTQQQRLSPQLNAPYDNLYPYDSTLYDDTATASRYPLSTHTLALDSSAGGMDSRHQSRASTAASYLNHSNPSGLQASGNIGHVSQSSYPTTTDATTPYSRRQQQHSRQQYQGQASLDTSSFTYPCPSTEIASWDDSSESQATYSHPRAPESGQYPAHNESNQRRQGRHRGDGRQGGRG